MQQYWFICDTNGVLYYPPQLSATNPWPNPPATLTVVSFPQATASSTAIMAYTYPSRYLYQVGAFVEQPFFTLSATSASGNITLTATLNNPPATPPTSCTFSVLGQTITAPLTSNVATLTLAVHPSVASQQLSISVTTTGCVQAAVIAGGTASGIPLQAYQDVAKAWRVAPTLKAVLQAYYASLIPQQLVAANTLVGISLLADAIFNVLLTPSVVANLTTDQQNMVKDFQANVSKILPLTLANACPASGTKEIHYESFEANMPIYAESVTGYNADVANIPNLT
jgi:hypothetical protein